MSGAIDELRFRAGADIDELRAERKAETRAFQHCFFAGPAREEYGAALLGQSSFNVLPLAHLEVSPRQAERGPDVTQHLEVDADWPLGANGKQREVPAMRDIEIQLAPGEEGSAMRPLVEDQFPGRAIQIPAENSAQSTAAGCKARAIALADETSGAFKFRGIQHVWACRSCGCGCWVELYFPHVADGVRQDASGKRSLPNDPVQRHVSARSEA
jgi:hypothetical protein